MPGRNRCVCCCSRRRLIRVLNSAMERLKGVSGSCPAGCMRSAASKSLKMACMIIILFTLAREMASSTSLRRRDRERKDSRHTRSLPSTMDVAKAEKSAHRSQH